LQQSKVTVLDLKKNFMSCEICLNGAYSNCPCCSEDEEQLKEVTAHVSLEVWVNCPHCDNKQDVSDALIDNLDENLCASNLEVEIKCDNNNCQEKFIITKANY